MLLTLTIHAYAQKDFIPGKVVINGGDTLNGFISTYRDAYGITFRNEKNETRSYAPKHIDGFVMDNISFISRKVKLKVERDTVQDECFLQVLADGRISLYTYKNTYDQDIFFAEKDNGIIQLRKVIEKVQPEKGGFIYTREKKEYLNMLTILMQDCSKITLPITDVELTAKDLTKIVTKYNYFFGGKIETKSKEVKKQIAFGLKAGTTITNKESYYKSSTNSIVGKSIGAFIKLPLSGVNRRMFMRIDANMNDIGFKFKDQTYKWDSYNIAGTLGHNFSAGRVRPYVGLSGIFSFMKKNTIAVIQSSSTYPLPPSPDFPAGSVIRFENDTYKSTFTNPGYAFEAGVEFWKVFVATRYEVLLSNGGKAINISVGYRFN